MNKPSVDDYLLKHETEVHLAYYSSIGRVIVAWSILESQWDINMWCLWNSLDGHTQAKEPARAMSRKIDFWNKCFLNLPHLEPRRKAALTFSSRLDAAATNRNLLLHTEWGNVLSADWEADVEGSGFKTNANGFSSYRATMSLRSLHLLLNEIAALQTYLLPITFFLTELVNARSAGKFGTPQSLDRNRPRVPNEE